MNALIDPDGTFMSALRKFADIVICNLLFCLLCIPFFTIGASLTGLHAAMQLLASDADDEGRSAPEVFLQTFRKDFKQSTLLWLICAAVIVFLVMYYFIVVTMTGTVGQVYKVTFLILVVVFLFGFQYMFPLEARYRLKIRDVIKNSYLISVAAFPWTFLSLAAPAFLVYISVFMNERGFFLSIFLWMTVGFGIVSYMDSFIFLRVFRKKGLEEDLSEPEADYDDRLKKQ